MLFRSLGFAGLEAADLFTGLGVPAEHSGVGSTLSSDGHASISGDGEAFDIVIVGIDIVLVVVLLSVDLTSSEVLLGVAGSVEDDTDGSGELGGAAGLVEVGVVATVVGSVTIDVLEFVVDKRLVGVEGVVVLGLDDLSLPG